MQGRREGQLSARTFPVGRGRYSRPTQTEALTGLDILNFARALCRTRYFLWNVTLAFYRLARVRSAAAAVQTASALGAARREAV